jgi:O-antigen/teichoic acid export membrane protein
MAGVKALRFPGFRDAPKAVISVLQNFGWMLASRGVSAVFSLIYLAIVTRSLGVEGFGKFALITGAAQLLANLLAFQTWQIIVQYGVNHIENNDEERLARLYRGALLLDAVSAFAGIIAAAIILHFFADALGLKDTLARATLIFNIIMLLSLRSTPLGILRLRDRFSLAAAAESATPTFRLIGAITVWLVHPKLQGFLIAWAIAELLTAAAHWYAVQKTGDLKLMTRRGANIRAIFADNPDILRYSLTTNFSQSLGMTTKQLPLFLVGGLTGTAAAGAYRLAAQLARSLTILARMIARAAFPEIVRAVRTHGVAGLSDMLMRSIRVALAASTIAFIIVVLLGQPVLKLVGGVEFGQAYHSLLWLAGAGCLELAIVAFEPAIMAAQRAHLAFFARLAATGVLIGGAVLLEPGMGADGVAAAVFANSVVQSILLALVLLGLIRDKDGQPDGDTPREASKAP